MTNAIHNTNLKAEAYNWQHLKYMVERYTPKIDKMNMDVLLQH